MCGMTTVQYVCASSNRTIHGKLDENTACFAFHQVAHLFGTRPANVRRLDDGLEVGQGELIETALADVLD